MGLGFGVAIEFRRALTGTSARRRGVAPATRAEGCTRGFAASLFCAEDRSGVRMLWLRPTLLVLLNLCPRGEVGLWRSGWVLA